MPTFIKRTRGTVPFVRNRINGSVPFVRNPTRGTVPLVRNIFRLANCDVDAASKAAGSRWMFSEFLENKSPLRFSGLHIFIVKLPQFP